MAALAAGARGRAEVLGNGDMEGGLWWASQAQGLITEVGSCAVEATGIVDTGSVPHDVQRYGTSRDFTREREPMKFVIIVI